jgi:hypothetical protein
VPGRSEGPDEPPMEFCDTLYLSVLTSSYKRGSSFAARIMRAMNCTT